jgi:hypothetical protein
MIDYDKDVRIDETALDVECLDQPSLMVKYARLLADAERELDKAKEALDLVKAELDKEIRSDPDKFDLIKATETSVANTVIMQPKYVEASNRVIEAKYEAKVLAGVVRAMDARKTMLETLVKLHGQQYFAGPNVPRDLSYEAQRLHAQKKVDQGVASKFTRKRKEE